MKRTGITLTAALLVVAGAATVAAGQSAGAPSGTVATADTVQDIETMRLVLVRVLKESVGEYLAENVPAKDPVAKGGGFGVTTGEAAGDYGAALGAYVTGAGGRYFYSWRQVTSNTRGFYAEGVGAIFSTELTVPLRIADAPSDDGERDLWREAESQRRGDLGGVTGLSGGAGRAARAGKVARRYGLDEEAVTTAVNAVIDALGAYGAKIEGLGDDDVIVVAMHLAGGQVIAEGEDEDKATVAAVAAGGGAGDLFYSTTFSGIDSGAAAVVRLHVADVRQFAAGSYNQKTLRERAVVTRY